MAKSNKIQHRARLIQLLNRWHRKASSPSSLPPPSPRLTTDARVPSDVPPGHVAVSVGSRRRRFVVRATYLNHLIFRSLLAQAEQEHGFHNRGPLAIPCDESIF
ncbi:hypothetical protein Nepgr_018124 [Nepenthes gracilis]|uniref:Small auxin up regulated protein n=1 Tax=Nepenthes gracilis TaxID=150966 RepID=A0AAD3SRP5_NEPGR|nr:hypothetical protein Nepgr_018124 [Nepenthes gracilis]